MPKRRIETTTSRTAEMTCMLRAASYLDSDPRFHSDDHLAMRLLPAKMAVAMRVPLLRALLRRGMAKAGIYQYVVARTRYVDAAMQQALSDGFEQVVILGAGLDTRALRLGGQSPAVRVFEVDAAPTQRDKLARCSRLGLVLPPNTVFVPMDLDSEPLPARLAEAGFRHGLRSLFTMEGLLMYLQQPSVERLFGAIASMTQKGSRVVFDYVLPSAARLESASPDGDEAARAVASVEETWRFGLDHDAVPAFVAAHGLSLVDHHDSRSLAALFFRNSAGEMFGRVNDAHGLATAERV